MSAKNTGRGLHEALIDADRRPQWTLRDVAMRERQHASKSIAGLRHEIEQHEAEIAVCRASITMREAFIVEIDTNYPPEAAPAAEPKEGT